MGSWLIFGLGVAEGELTDVKAHLLGPLAVMAAADHPLSSPYLSENLSHGVWLCNFSFIYIWALFPGVRLWFSRDFQRDFPGVTACKGAGVWAVQCLCKVHANWSGEEGGLLHGRMLLERRHRQPKKASIRWYQRCGHPREPLECA